MPTWAERRTGQSRKGNRRGDNFTVRIPPEWREFFAQAHAETAGPRGFGAWLLWAASAALDVGALPRKRLERALPGAPRAGTAPSSGTAAGAGTAGGALPGDLVGQCPPIRERVILDLCGGSGAWAQPYDVAGYRVQRVTLPDGDVRKFEPRGRVHGVLAAPPCTEFSIAKNGQPRDFAAGLETVCACLRIIALARPVWWALENPIGLLGRWLGAPRDTFEPYEFGDPWTKATALWGSFTLPRRGPFVEPTGSAMDRKTPALRAVTPPGFARAFFEANP